MTEPTPGSREAVEQGCTCPVVDNAHGRGRPAPNGETEFIYTAGCPVHSPEGDE